jgi:hypothetical protein
MSQSALNNAQLADCSNWLMREDGMAGNSLPVDHQPHTAEEVTALRARPCSTCPAPVAVDQGHACQGTIDDG